MRLPFPPSPSASGSTSAGGKFEETQEDGLRRMREDTVSSGGLGGISGISRISGIGGLSPEEEGEEYDEFGLSLVDIEGPSTASASASSLVASKLRASSFKCRRMRRVHSLASSVARTLVVDDVLGLCIDLPGMSYV